MFVFWQCVERIVFVFCRIKGDSTCNRETEAEIKGLMNDNKKEILLNHSQIQSLYYNEVVEIFCINIEGKSTGLQHSVLCPFRSY